MNARMRTLTAGIIAAGIATSTAAAAPPPAQVSLERAVIKQMNVVRAKFNRPVLKPNSALIRAARLHSAYMAETGTFQHEGPNNAPFWHRIVRQGMSRNQRMAENLAMMPSCDAATAKVIVKMWMDSPAHRANVLDPQLRSTGVGVALNPGCTRVMITADYASQLRVTRARAAAIARAKAHSRARAR